MDRECFIRTAKGCARRSTHRARSSSSSRAVVGRPAPTSDDYLYLASEQPAACCPSSPPLPLEAHKRGPREHRPHAEPQERLREARARRDRLELVVGEQPRAGRAAARAAVVMMRRRSQGAIAAAARRKGRGVPAPRWGEGTVKGRERVGSACGRKRRPSQRLAGRLCPSQAAPVLRSLT